MLAANNLSDVANAATAAENLGVGITDSPQFAGINVGHASDTTLTRAVAGRLAVEGVNVVTTSSTDTLSGKTINLANNTVTGTVAEFNTAISDGNIIPAAGGTFTGDISVPDEAYGVGWNGSVEVPTKNALYDKIETLGGGGTVDISGTPTAGQAAQWVDANTIEGVDAVNFSGLTAKPVLVSGDQLLIADSAAAGAPKNATIANLETYFDSVYQAGSANLDEYAAVNPTAAGLALLDDADASAQRTTLGLGNVANVNLTTGALVWVIDGGGSAITTGVKGYLQVPFACTITGWRALADQSGSIVVDVWKDTYANYPPTVADTIAGTEKPTLSAVIKNEDTSLSTWTTSVSAGDILGFNVDSVATVTKVTLEILVTRT
jgi:hypothetical protein